MKSAWYTQKGWIIVIHIAVWVGLFSLPYLLHPDKTGASRPAKEVLQYCISNLIWVAFFYGNALWLIPGFLNKNLYGKYIAALVLAYIVLLFAEGTVFLWFTADRKLQLRTHVIFTLLLFLFFAATSLAYRLITDKIRSDNLAKDRENENLKTELSFLRSQASPHFMFNVLNNMVALARKKSDMLEPSLIKLSSLIRYMVYETNEETVQLDKEIEYLESYIDLQKQRFGNNVTFDVFLREPQQNYAIEPMLLVPFVENAIKHGTGFIEHAHIVIDLRVEDNVLLFYVKNRYDEMTDEIKDKTSGIGLVNVRRRLDLLYNKNHTLQIDGADGWFSVALKLNLH